MIISLQEFQDYLIERAAMIGWQATNDPLLVSDKFRGREMSEGGALPENRLGVRLGAYPVILSMIELEREEYIAPQLRSLHSQVLIARSYLRAHSIVDLHLFLLTHAKQLTVTQATQVDRIERDEAICRKQICVVQEDVEASLNLFLERTFLARPWTAAMSIGNTQFQLDRPVGLVRQILLRQGLSPAAADAWVRLADDYVAAGRPEPVDLVDQLVSATVSDNV